MTPLGSDVNTNQSILWIRIKHWTSNLPVALSIVRANHSFRRSGEPLCRRVADALLSRRSRLRFDNYVVVHSPADSLFAPQVPFGHLDGNMSE